MVVIKIMLGRRVGERKIATLLPGRISRCSRYLGGQIYRSRNNWKPDSLSLSYRIRTRCETHLREKCCDPSSNDCRHGYGAKRSFFPFFFSYLFKRNTGRERNRGERRPCNMMYAQPAVNSPGNCNARARARLPMESPPPVPLTPRGRIIIAGRVLSAT